MSPPATGSPSRVAAAESQVELPRGAARTSGLPVINLAFAVEVLSDPSIRPSAGLGKNVFVRQVFDNVLEADRRGLRPGPLLLSILVKHPVVGGISLEPNGLADMGWKRVDVEADRSVEFEKVDIFPEDLLVALHLNAHIVPGVLEFGIVAAECSGDSLHVGDHPPADP